VRVCPECCFRSNNGLMDFHHLGTMNGFGVKGQGHAKNTILAVCFHDTSSMRGLIFSQTFVAGVSWNEDELCLAFGVKVMVIGGGIQSLTLCTEFQPSCCFHF